MVGTMALTTVCPCVKTLCPCVRAGQVYQQAHCLYAWQLSSLAPGFPGTRGTIGNPVECGTTRARKEVGVNQV
jgi:hypothetical protein